MREETSKIENNSSYDNGINGNDKGSNDAEKCLIVFHDIVLPPSLVSIAKRIIERQTTKCK